ncbi:hypothetical protein DCS_02919 [Drechmeria coniospora]|uniref:NCT transcriptional regulatory complex subunit A n=1 Tax=Drechmeria coniospora TaxID=98403 RepID=A0A151GXD9_DRECN|nr:hypothetical protein DCS_02919 [Drechmeria coniospora]KYK61775.1 hypothetical protein DCS_02919 [Drechmeria coniospora]
MSGDNHGANSGAANASAANAHNPTHEYEHEYAPKSPDLSSFYSAGPAPPALQLHPPSQNRGEYKLQSPTYGHGAPYGSSYAPPISPAGHNLHTDLTPYSPSTQQQAHLPRGPPQPSALPSYGLQPSPTPNAEPQPARPYHPGQYLTGPSQQAGAPSHHQGSFSASPASPTKRDRAMPPRRAAAAAAPPPPAIEPSPVRTKFPTARIKRIMQADEEVGKVAQQTPIAVGKALELFMIQLVTKSADVAQDKGSKRVTAAMLKQVVENDDQWDFLRDIVSRVENEKEGARARPKAESDSDEELSEPKRRGRGGRKRKI